MQPIFSRTCAAILVTLAAAPAFATAPADYAANFTMSYNNLDVLSTGRPLFDAGRDFAGTWTDDGRFDARTLTTDLTSYTPGPGSTIVPTWGAHGYDENRDRAGNGPLSFGGTYAIACGSPGEGCATGSHTASYASVYGDKIAASVSLTDLHAQADTQASWSRGFTLEAHSSFTFSGFATVTIAGDDAPLQGGTRIANDSDSWMTVSSMTFGDLLGRARTVLGASVWGANSAFADIDYLMGANGFMSLTVTNNSGAALLGSLNAGSFVNLSPPIPEPATWLMLLAGAGIVGAASRRRVRAVAA